MKKKTKKKNHSKREKKKEEEEGTLFKDPISKIQHFRFEFSDLKS